MGPLVIMSSLIPNKLTRMNDTLIRKKGIIKTAQNLGNSFINQFLFVTRPNEALRQYIFSEKQQKIVERDILRKVKTSKHHKDILASYSDFLLREKMSKNI
jgi:hypothetical protein